MVNVRRIFGGANAQGASTAGVAALPQALQRMFVNRARRRVNGTAWPPVGTPLNLRIAFRHPVQIGADRIYFPVYELPYYVRNQNDVFTFCRMYGYEPYSQNGVWFCINPQEWHMSWDTRLRSRGVIRPRS